MPKKRRRTLQQSLPSLRRIVTRFCKCYIARRGYREGPYGFLVALCAALYPILSYLKARLEPEASPPPEARAATVGDCRSEPAAPAAEDERLPLCR